MLIKFGYFALFQGKEYEVDQDLDSGKYILISEDAEDLKKGFHDTGDDYYEKHVLPSEIESAYSIHTYGEYAGHAFEIESMEDGNARLVYSGMQTQIARELGFGMIEKGVYEKIVPVEELVRIWYDKKPIWGYSLPSE